MTAASSQPARHVLHVCTTCRRLPGSPDVPRDGAALYEAIRAASMRQPDRPELILNAVECMSGCNRACTVGLSAPGKTSYLFGDLAANAETATQALELAALYCASGSGVLMRAERPALFRAGILARIPALAETRK